MRYRDERGCFEHARPFALWGVGLTTLSRPLPAALGGLPGLSRSAPRPQCSPGDTQEPSLWIPERGYQRLGMGTRCSPRGGRPRVGLRLLGAQPWPGRGRTLNQPPAGRPLRGAVAPAHGPLAVRKPRHAAEYSPALSDNVLQEQG